MAVVTNTYPPDTPATRRKAARMEAFARGQKTVTAADTLVTSSDGDFVGVAWDMGTYTGNYTLDIGPAVGFVGRTITVKDTAGTADDFNIIINPYGSETIDGAATLEINTAYGYARIYSNGSAWFEV